MCDASDFTIGVVVGRHINKVFHTIYSASKTLNKSQMNNTTTEKKLLVVVYVVNKFKSYLIGTRVIVRIDHLALKYLLQINEVKPRLIIGI